MIQNKIIHIFDDDKFIDPAIKLFEEVIPNRSKYIVISKTEGDFKYVSSKLAIQKVLKNKNDISTFSSEINQSESNVIFLHSLNAFKFKIVNKLIESKIKVWFVWGYDLYGSWEILKKQIYSSKTKQILNNKTSLRKRLKNNLIFNNITYKLYLDSKESKYYVPQFLKQILKNNYDTEYYRALLKMDIVVPVLPTEFQYIQNMGLKAQYAPFTYGCLEDLLGENIDKNVLQSQNILVGNSADPANNHIDVFIKLSSVNLENRKVYVPLSYSGKKEYVENVIKQGKHYLGDNFVPLINFMPLNKYNDILLSCGFVIFNQLRQQGVGNLISMGYLGAKMFFNKKSPTYKYYKQLGLEVFNINELNNVNCSENLTANQMEINRGILFKTYSQKAVHDKVKELVHTVESFKK